MFNKTNHCQFGMVDLSSSNDCFRVSNTLRSKLSMVEQVVLGFVAGAVVGIILALLLEGVAYFFRKCSLRAKEGLEEGEVVGEGDLGDGQHRDQVSFDTEIEMIPSAPPEIEMELEERADRLVILQQHLRGPVD